MEAKIELMFINITSLISAMDPEPARWIHGRLRGFVTVYVLGLPESTVMKNASKVIVVKIEALTINTEALTIDPIKSLQFFRKRLLF